MDGDFYNSGLKREHTSDDLNASNGMGDANDAKKAKYVENPPSRVVHIRSLPNDVSESDVIQLGMPFGKMSNCLLLSSKNQAFLEFEDESCAVNMVTYFETNSALVRQKSCYVQYSNHQQLKTDPSNMQSGRGFVGSGSGLLRGERTAVLRVMIDNLQFPVGLDVLEQLFSRFGDILKIITFNKNNIYQALIQYADIPSTTKARDALDGQNIYNGCNTLKIDYSRMANLQVKYNNDKSRDFTRPDLPTGEEGIMNLHRGSRGMGLMGSGPPGMSGSGSNILGLGGFNFGNMGNMSNMAHNMDNRMDNMGMGGVPSSPVVLVSNMDEEKVTTEALFILFGVYGNVHRVKIMFNKKDNALIQMASAAQAQQAITFLDKARVWGKSLRVTQSKHQSIQLPKDGQSDAGLTKDFSHSEHHRFKRSNSKNYIFPPTPVLHLYNVNTLDEDEIKSMFEPYGTVLAFKFFHNDNKMALIQMSNSEEATHAMMGLHNYQIGDNLHLRVSFSKSSI